MSFASFEAAAPAFGAAARRLFVGADGVAIGASGSRAIAARLPRRASACTAWEPYRLFAIYGWLAATATLAMGSKWQPEALAISSTQRATEALEDLECEVLVADR